MWTTIGLVFNVVFQFLRPVIMQIVALVSKELLENVLYTVKALQETELSNTEKRNEAFYQIKERLKMEGKELTDSMINLLIEFAVQKLKN